MSNTKILTHFHLFKNAGSTVEWILERNFGHAFHRPHQTGERGVITTADIVRYVEANPEVQALSSHHFRYPMPVTDKVSLVDIFFVRHPLDRIQSMYLHYSRWDDPFTQKSTLARELGMAGFTNWLLENEPFNMINSQTSYMARGGEYYYPPTRRDVQTAKAMLEDVRFLGVVERFEDSLVAAEFFLRPSFPSLQLAYLSQNVVKGRAEYLEARLDRLKEGCGQTLYDRLRRLNELDEELWYQGTNELDRRLGCVPDVEGKLEALRAECKRLSSAKPNYTDKATAAVPAKPAPAGNAPTFTAAAPAPPLAASKN